MQEIQNQKQLAFYLEKHHIRDLFDTPSLPFRLYRYEVGEMMNILHPGQEYLKFIVEGSFDFYAIRADGVRNIFYHCKGFIFLGDLQCCGKDQGVRYQCPNQTISSVSQTATRLHYSLRQTQRVLQELTKEGLLKRKGKGHYVLKEHDESGCSAFLMKKKDCFM